MNENENTVKKSYIPKSARIIALILAVLLVGEIILSNSAAVSFSSQKYDDSEYQQAAEYIEQNDSYLTASKLARMRAVASMLGTPKTYDQFSLFASVAIADEDYAAAADYLLKAIEVCENENEIPTIYIKIGCLMALDGNWEASAEYFNQAIELDGSNPDARLMLTEAYLNAGDYESALSSLEAYALLKELSSEEFDALIQLKINLGKYDEALASCGEAEQAGSLTEADAALYRAQVYYMKGDYPNALEHAEKCRNAGGDTVKTDSIIILCSEEAGDYETSLKACLELIDKDLAEFSIYQQGVQDAYTVADYDAVIRIGEKALEKFAENDDISVIRKWLGLSYFEKNDLTNAEINLGAVIDGGESAPELYYLRGICRMGSEKYREAVSDFTSSLASEELTDEALYNRGLCYIQLGDNEAASIDFQEIIDRDSDDDVIALICELLEISPEELEEAREN